MPITLKRTIRIHLKNVTIENGTETKNKEEDKKIQNITTKIKTQSKKVLR